MRKSIDIHGFDTLDRADFVFISAVLEQRLAGVPLEDTRASFRRMLDRFVATHPERHEVGFETWATGQFARRMGLIDAVYGADIEDVDEVVDDILGDAGEDVGGELAMWTIYHDTRDFPGGYTVRRCRVVSGGRLLQDPECVHADSLEEARLRLPPGLSWLPRSTEDDPTIVEVWM